MTKMIKNDAMDFFLDPLRTPEQAQARQDAVRGCLLGGAIGDALGYPVEFYDEDTIFSTYGPHGITAYERNPRSGKAVISDDTQMTLFTANGLLAGDTHLAMKEVRKAPRYYVARAYLDWLMTQTCSMEEVQQNQRNTKKGGYSWLLDVPELYHRRAPGNTCLSGLTQEWNGESFDDYVAAKRNNSCGCGGVMRVAPLALNYEVDMEELDMEAAQLAAITHGNSLGYMPAAVLVHVINRIVFPPEDKNLTLKEIVLEARDTVAKLFAGDAQLARLTGLIDLAVSLSEETGTGDLDKIHQLGEGWVGEEALAISLYCALKYQHDFSAGIIAAVNHRGDSDSTGAITGNILGALLGYQAIEDKWKRDLELIDVILELADDVSDGCPMNYWGHVQDEEWTQKYIYMRRLSEDDFF